jgi:hypothetical protein
MNLSSRWCVTAVVALGALGCSDPVPPPAQGAFIAEVRSGVAGRQCPSGASITYDVPAIAATDPTPQCQQRPATSCKLDADTYLHHVINGEDGVDVSCSVKGKSTFTFEGQVRSGGQSIAISGGTLGADGKGTARITLAKSNTPGFSNALSSAPGACTIQAMVGPDGKLQAKGGSMWASYTCPVVLHEPGEGCAASGYFVLENCDQ